MFIVLQFFFFFVLIQIWWTSYIGNPFLIYQIENNEKYKIDFYVFKKNLRKSLDNSTD